RVSAAGPGGRALWVGDVGAGEPAIRHAVEQLRALIDSRRGPLLRQGLDQQARELGRLILGPVASRLGGARRILVVPDGVLHLLPFAALVDPSDPKGQRYLVECAPLHVVSSVTLYAQLTRPRADPRSSGVAGLGHPPSP